MCSACDKVVHDLSQRSAREVRALVAGGPVCVRYLYDVHGNILLDGAPAGARVIPAGALLTKIARSKWLAAAVLVGVPMVFEACGGNAGGYGGTYADRADAGASDDDTAATPTPRDTAEPRVDNAGDASDGDAGDASDGDAGPGP